MLCERREIPQWISYQVFHDKLKNMVKKNKKKKKTSNKMSVPISNNNEFYIRDKVFV